MRVIRNVESKENDMSFVIPLLFAVTPIHSYLKEIKMLFCILLL